MARKPPRISRKQLELIRSLAERCGARTAARISMGTLKDPAGRGVNVFNPTTAPGTSSFGRTRQMVEFISGPEASQLIDALKAAATKAGKPAAPLPPDAPESLRRLDRVAQRLGVKLNGWGKTGRWFTYQDDLVIRYRPQGKGTFYIESRLDGELQAHTVVAAGRIERYFTNMQR